MYNSSSNSLLRALKLVLKIQTQAYLKVGKQVFLEKNQSIPSEGRIQTNICD